jgi:hypothetical protein
MVLRHHSDPSRPHRAASVPRIRICLPHADQQDLPQISVYVSGKHIAVAVEYEYASGEGEVGNGLYVFDWRTGDTRVVSQNSRDRNIQSKIEITGASLTRL